jgi:hypothetical protein
MDAHLFVALAVAERNRAPHEAEGRERQRRMRKCVAVEMEIPTPPCESYIHRHKCLGTWEEGPMWLAMIQFAGLSPSRNRDAGRSPMSRPDVSIWQQGLAFINLLLVSRAQVSSYDVAIANQ